MFTELEGRMEDLLAEEEETLADKLLLLLKLISKSPRYLERDGFAKRSRRRRQRLGRCYSSLGGVPGLRRWLAEERGRKLGEGGRKGSGMEGVRERVT